MKTAPDWAEFSAEALDSWAARRAIGTHELVRIAGMLAGPRRADLVRSGQMQCPDLTVAGLTAQPWHDPADYPWTKTVAEATGEILAEVDALCAAGPLARHGESSKLATAGHWRHFDLLKMGLELPEARRDCPNTLALLQSVPEVAEYGSAYLAIAAPGTRLVPHYGPINARLRCHLGLHVPGRCWLEVGGERRTWAEGSCVVFDDSFEHSVGNDDDRDRIVLIFDVWHPELAEAERSALGFLLRDLPVALPEVCAYAGAPTLFGGEGR